MTTVTAENVQRAATALWDNDIRPGLAFSDYLSEIEECYQDSVTDYIEQAFNAENFEGIEYEDEDEKLADIASDIESGIMGELDYRMAYGAPDEWVETHVIWTSDILDYYRDNEAECDDVLGELDWGDVTSISEIIARCVTVARMSEANALISELVDDFTNNAYTDSLRDYLR